MFVVYKHKLNSMLCMSDTIIAYAGSTTLLKVASGSSTDGELGRSEGSRNMHGEFGRFLVT